MEQLIVQDGLHTVRERELNTHQPAMYMYVCTRATPSQTHIKTTARHLPSQTNIQPVTTCTCTCTCYCQTPLPSPHLQGSGVWSPPLLVPYDGLQQLVVEGEAEVQPQPGKASTGRLPFLGGGGGTSSRYMVHTCTCTCTVEPPIKDAPNKGHLRIMDICSGPQVSFIRRFHCTCDQYCVYGRTCTCTYVCT